ncbi:MAG TPA: O-antigen ligase family protein [Candidatus Polarisedimenticolia bacterium]|jgi:O-antigen ligase|nr:O-antigen ligase family protein [Candidatus Polarisedimenticolia bacterium]
MMRFSLLAVGAGIVLLAPFREGGRDPAALFLLHSLVLLYVAVASPAWMRSIRIGRPDFTDPLVPVALAMGAALAAAGASALAAAYPYAAGLGACDFLMPCLLLAVAALAATAEADLSRLRALVAVSSAAQALLVLARYPGGGAMAAGASFLNPSHLAAFLNLGFFLSATAAAAPVMRPRARFLWAASAALHLLSIGLLESRGAFLALLAGLVVFAIRERRRMRPRLRAIAFLMIGLLGLTMSLVLHQRFARAEDPYRYRRVEIWKAAWQMVRDRPLLGYGPANFPHVSPAYNFPIDDGPVRYGRTFHGAHNAYLTLVAEAGAPGAACFAAAAVASLLALLRRKGRAAAIDLDGSLSGVGLAILALLVHATVEDLQERPALTILPALLAGTALGVLRRSPAVLSWSPARPARLLIAAGLAYLFLLAVLLPFLADREARIAHVLGREGLRHMQRAAALVPFQPEYHHDLAMALLNSEPLSPDSLAGAQSELLDAERLKPIDYRFPLLRARLEARLVPRLYADPAAGARAVELYDRATRLAPLDPRPRIELAAHLVELGKRDQALLIIREALGLEPGFVRARILEASILLDMGRRDEARASLAAAGTTVSSLPAQVQDSGYAREILADSRSERERLEVRLSGSVGDPDPRSPGDFRVPDRAPPTPSGR